jgi:DNA-directed RNA polymerase subunit RPC12/RpoP
MPGPDFLEKTKQTLAKRAGQVCSNPDCRRATSGPHSEEDKSVNLGEAAHIKAAREGQARYDSNMTDEQRRDIANGIWLCKECARKIDLDEKRYSVELLIDWKKRHENWISTGKPGDAGREVIVKDGGIGSIVANEGQGTALDVQHQGKGPAERIVVEGEGVGEIVTNTGQGTGKRIVSRGGAAASDTHVNVSKPVNMAVGMSSTVVRTDCNNCGRTVQFSKVIQGFAGDNIPKAEVKCPYCGGINLI